jgi:hypothetical protein
MSKRPQTARESSRAFASTTSSSRRGRLSKALLLSAASLALLSAPGANATLFDLGVYKGGGDYQLVPNFENWMGAEVPRALDFYSDSSWADLTNNAWLLNSWKGQRWAMTFSIAMLPGDGSSTLAAGATGAYNSNWTTIAQNLVNAGFGSATLRIGWEFNGGWYPWAAEVSPSNYAAYWQKIVTTMRAVSGAHFRFDWCVAQGYQQFPAEQAYPGDSYVDVVGIDAYNESWISNYTDPVARWQDVYNGLTSGNHGILFWIQFARTHNKPLSFPEWATGTRPDGHGGGDDPYYIQQMYNVISTNNVAYHDYWDYPASDFNGQLSNNQYPNAGTTFKQTFGQSMITGKFQSRTFEAEALVVANYSGPDVRTFNATQLSSGEGSILDSSAVGNYITYVVPNVPAATYSVRIGVKTTTTRGIWQLAIGRADNFSGTESNVGTPQDEYSAAENYTEFNLGNWTPGTTSDKRFQFKVTGKNSASTGYTIAFDYMKLVPQ